jgi:hypothetical protein
MEEHFDGSSILMEYLNGKCTERMESCRIPDVFKKTNANPKRRATSDYLNTKKIPDLKILQTLK